MDTPAPVPAPNPIVSPHPKRATIIGILGAVVAIGAFLLAAHFLNFWPFGIPETTFCTMEAKICPDGSGVGRSGPNCEFAPCPESITYSNSQYGFSVTLPSSWKGYTIETYPYGTTDIATGEPWANNGLEIAIRHPLWTEDKPRQDIPIMVFEMERWNLLMQEKISVGAAPIPPSELARNSRFVFALPARYNYAFPVGFEEVETILAGKPVAAYNPPAATSTGSGVSGVVLTGPTCPVVRVDDPSCDDKPYQGQFIVRSATNNAEVARFTTDASGRFQVALAPGTYTIQPVMRIGMSDQPQTVTVESGKVTDATLLYDTGIR